MGQNSCHFLGPWSCETGSDRLVFGLVPQFLVCKRRLPTFSRPQKIECFDWNRQVGNSSCCTTWGNELIMASGRPPAFAQQVARDKLVPKGNGHSCGYVRLCWSFAIGMIIYQTYQQTLARLRQHPKLLMCCRLLGCCVLQALCCYCCVCFRNRVLHFANSLWYGAGSQVLRFPEFQKRRVAVESVLPSGFYTGAILLKFTPKMQTTSGLQVRVAACKVFFVAFFQLRSHQLHFGWPPSCHPRCDQVAAFHFYHSASHSLWRLGTSRQVVLPMFRLHEKNNGWGPVGQL